MSGNAHRALKLCSGTYFRHSCSFMALSLSSWLCKFIYIKTTTIPQNLLTENFKLNLLLIPFEKKMIKSICLPCLQLHWHWALHHRWSVWRSARWLPWWYQGIFHRLYFACHSFPPGADCSAWSQLGSLDESTREPGHRASTQQKKLISVKKSELKAIFFKTCSMKINTFFFYFFKIQSLDISTAFSLIKFNNNLQKDSLTYLMLTEIVLTYIIQYILISSYKS